MNTAFHVTEEITERQVKSRWLAGCAAKLKYEELGIWMDMAVAIFVPVRKNKHLKAEQWADA